MFVLVEFVNEYNQEGGYFAGVFSSMEKLLNEISHLGRRDNENYWYEAYKVEEGEIYTFTDDSRLVVGCWTEGKWNIKKAALRMPHQGT